MEMLIFFYVRGWDWTEALLELVFMPRMHGRAYPPLQPLPKSVEIAPPAVAH
jgi:hypothetical protein